MLREKVGYESDRPITRLEPRLKSRKSIDQDQVPERSSQNRESACERTIVAGDALGKLNVTIDIQYQVVRHFMRDHDAYMKRLRIAMSREPPEK